MTTQTKIKFPTIKEIKVQTETVDEWYGIEVWVTWTEPFDSKAFAQENKAEMERWFKQNPKMAYCGPWPLEKALRDHVVAQVLVHPGYAAYYAKPHFATCEEYEDGPERQVRIPRFKADDFHDWDFQEKGGSLSASDR